MSRDSREHERRVGCYSCSHGNALWLRLGFICLLNSNARPASGPEERHTGTLNAHTQYNAIAAVSIVPRPTDGLTTKRRLA